MSRRISEVPFVVGSDGGVFVNVLHFFKGTPTANVLLKRAIEEQGDFVVAVRLGPAEVQELLGRIGSGAGEAVAFAVGARDGRRKGRSGVLRHPTPTGSDPRYRASSQRG